ncbi:MAG: aminoglycoside phosphotransferase family protein [Propionicimonas sp.]|uniref:aminoglycoside phosphotransferase family protein n=1 Tax=Propionicimonas sp. TaxID=1955623 RepID=UPI002B202899|nr:aminoglycoside phosphotransferase family protein [Propionicimonas sp.]MEA4944216.1 aminoglycoside phosphotransferase family protein [Propionicimonas sp.]MEA5053659.1 aminoglycoside phosphotransferase family protein [Propionicimonas sp.]MEA5117659.1 aminoglycoside phosphotransferase family protein [Propionicimonas sp.]
MPSAQPDPDGSTLLTSPEVGSLLAAAVDHAGGTLVTWALDHVDANPPHSTTATYSAVVTWPYGQRDELLGVSARASGPVASDAAAEIFADGEREVAVWLYPQDPDLPGLARAAYAESMAEVCNAHQVFSRPVAPSDLSLHMVGYRPRRRAVVRVSSATGEVVYVKVLRARLFDDVVRRHQLLVDAGLPVAPIAATTDDHLLILRELPGTPLARAVFEPADPCTAADLIALLDSLPASVARLERRPPWSEAVAHYATVVARGMPALQPRLDRLVAVIQDGLASVGPGNEPTHGDFHEGQLHVAGGRICGLLDIDTLGPGHRVDDLACLVAHLSTIQRMNPAQQDRVHQLIRSWVPVFDTRVDPTQLRLRSAAVIISLATGPFRGQEPDWERETSVMIGSAEALVRQVS